MIADGGLVKVLDFGIAILLLNNQIRECAAEVDALLALM
jgi:hypothetical protein